VGAGEAPRPMPDLTRNDSVSPSPLSTPLHEDTISSASRDLPIPYNLDTNPIDDMIENILEDTLTNLNQMSLKTSTSKVNPLKVIPYLRLTS